MSSFFFVLFCLIFACVTAATVAGYFEDKERKRAENIRRRGGHTGCKFAASDTKRHAEEIARWCETRVELDTPVNIHLTGCHHSCAQHFVSEIGLLACKVQADDEEADPVEGYHILVGGGFGPNAALGRELYRDVIAEDAPRAVERILRAYLTHRASQDERFLAFSRRFEIDALKAMTEREAAE